MGINPHTELVNQSILYANGRSDVRLFPNRVGFDRERRIPYGLVKGSHDLIGPKTVLITPEMVGQYIAVFCSFDAKTGNAVMTKEQKNWANMVESFGGITGAIRSVQDLERLLTKW